MKVCLEGYILQDSLPSSSYINIQKVRLI